MEKSEQRILIKYFAMKGLGSGLIYAKLTSVLHDSAYSLSAIEKWVGRFKTGVATWEDNPRPGRPPSDLGSPLAAFLMEFPFASAGQMAKHFRASHYTIKETLGR
jgi:transposase